MGYTAGRTVQITEMHATSSTLVVHEMNADGTPSCKQSLRKWRGQQMKFTPRGAGFVTCRRCEQAVNAN